MHNLETGICLMKLHKILKIVFIISVICSVHIQIIYYIYPSNQYSINYIFEAIRARSIYLR